MKQYLLQTRYDDGSVGAAMAAWPAIIHRIGFSDCSGEEHEVYDVSEFGKVVKLEHNYGDRFNYHIFTRTDTGEVVFEGESPEH